MKQRVEQKVACSFAIQNIDSEAEQKTLQFSHIQGLNETITAQPLTKVNKISQANL